MQVDIRRPLLPMDSASPPHTPEFTLRRPLGRVSLFNNCIKEESPKLTKRKTVHHTLSSTPRMTQLKPIIPTRPLKLRFGESNTVELDAIVNMRVKELLQYALSHFKKHLSTKEERYLLVGIHGERKVTLEAETRIQDLDCEEVLLCTVEDLAQSNSKKQETSLWARLKQVNLLCCFRNTN